VADSAKPQKYGALWSRDELILAFDLYCRISFGKTSAKNPHVMKLAELLKRSPAGVGRKLGNFASFDPELQKRQISGLTHASKLDREIWDEFNSDWNRLVLEATRLREGLTPAPEVDHEDDSKIVLPQGASEKEATRKARIFQSFFRDTILSNYEETCCITGLRIRECLVAGHIIPWSVSERLRADPRNGLCLSATFDRLFDRGLMTISEDFKVIVSSALRNLGDKRINDIVCRYHGSPMLQPRRFMPLEAHLQWHRSNVYRE
jgi:putative restriction endonuclease